MRGTHQTPRELTTLTNFFSGRISTVIAHLDQIRADGFDNIDTCIEAYSVEYGEARVSAGTRYFRDRPETDEEWASRVERESLANETSRKYRAAHRSALAKLTDEEKEAIHKFGLVASRQV